jgi:hypothetical protein
MLTTRCALYVLSYSPQLYASRSIDSDAIVALSSVVQDVHIHST